MPRGSRQRLRLGWTSHLWFISMAAVPGHSYTGWPEADQPRAPRAWVDGWDRRGSLSYLSPTWGITVSSPPNAVMNWAPGRESCGTTGWVDPGQEPRVPTPGGPFLPLQLLDISCEQDRPLPPVCPQPSERPQPVVGTQSDCPLGDPTALASWRSQAGLAQA